MLWDGRYMYVDLTAIVSQALSNITASSVVLTSFKLRLVKLTAILTQESSRKKYLPQRLQRCFLKCSYWSFADLPRGWNLAGFLQLRVCHPSSLFGHTMTYCSWFHTPGSPTFHRPTLKSWVEPGDKATCICYIIFTDSYLYSMYPLRCVFLFTGRIKSKTGSASVGALGSDGRTVWLPFRNSTSRHF